MNLGNSLKIALTLKGIKQKDFALLVGVKPQQISNWVCSGDISKRNLELVCEELGMPVSEFVRLGES